MIVSPRYRNVPVALLLALCLGFGLFVRPLSPAFAQDIVIDGTSGPAGDGNVGNVYGNSPTPDGTTLPLPPTPDATDNNVTVNNGANVTGSVDGGYATMIAGTGSATATGNSVFINGGMVGGSANGGRAFSSDATTTARGNSVTINNGAIVTSTVIGGYAQNTAGTAIASGNTVSINGGMVGQRVWGGYADGDIAATATGNSVVISGGTLNGWAVYGGYARSGSAATATYNTVTISGSPTFSDPTVVIYGGFTTGAGAGDAFTGNTLNVVGVNGLKVAGIQNFQNYNFLSAFVPGATLIQITGADPVNLAGTNVTFNGGNRPGGGGQRFFPGQSMTLIDKTQNTPASMTAAPSRQGIAMLYLFSISADNGQLVVTNVAAGAAPEAKSLSEGRAGSHAFINQGGNHAANKGMKAASESMNMAGTHFSAFASAEGGYSTYTTGSHVDVRGVALITGIAWKPELPYGKVLLAPFFEAGWGGYDSYNTFSGADVGGKGNISYYGGGLLLRYDFPFGLYVEASGRAGGVRTDYSSSDLRDMDNRKASYDIHTAYYGAHAGLGYIWNFTEKASLDLYAKYLWSHQEGKSVSVCGDKIDFKAMDSHRLRGGARFSYAINEYITPYIGAAYEQEFDGRARASVYGHRISTPDLIGGTGMGELGLTLKPSKDLPLSFDLGVQGYVGKREGVTGSMPIQYEF
jgi:hypothetical protein